MAALVCLTVVYANIRICFRSVISDQAIHTDLDKQLQRTVDCNPGFGDGCGISHIRTVRIQLYFKRQTFFGTKNAVGFSSKETQVQVLIAPQGKKISLKQLSKIRKNTLGTFRANGICKF